MAKSLGISVSHSNFRLVAVALSLAAALPFGQAMAKGGGIAGYSGKTGLTCTDCHGAGAAVPTVAFGGSTSVAPGATSNYTFTIKGGPAVAASLDIAASGGTLAPVSTGTKLLTSEIVHTTAAAFPASGAVFNFKWTAPTTAGTYTLYGAGLSSNGSGSSGDGTAATKLIVTVAAATTTPTLTPTPAPTPVPQKPTAAITAPTTGVAGAAVNFDGSKSTAPTGRTIATYDWNFGDNSAGAGAKVTHTYSAGNYTATLNVTDSTGATGSATTNIKISAAGTSALTANAGGPYTGTIGIPVQFDASASAAPGGSITSYTWNFGDNTSGTGVKPTHSYSAAGNYAVKVTVTDNTGTNATAGASLAISAAGTTPNPTPPPANQSAVGAPRLGQRLFDANCASCHGATGAGTPGSVASIIGASSRDIATAIATEPEMNTPALNGLSRTEIRAISHFLRGEQLYQANCESCHGVGGVGTATGTALLGATDVEITDAIATVPVMQTAALRGLTAREIDLIAFFLPRDPLAAATIRGLRSRALTPSLDTANDYPQLDLVEAADAAPAASSHLKSAAGSMDWLALAAFGAFALRRRRK